MKKYTIGALFTSDFNRVLLIQKERPQWQKGKLNFPGGHIEVGEWGHDCIAREFFEETNLKIPSTNWTQIGLIENEGEYTVEFYTAVYNEGKHGEPITRTEEKIVWIDCQNNSWPENLISNLAWLIPFAKNYHKQGNADGLVFGHFMYKY
jgi:8-oxo-dGTP diphosphatase